MAKKTLTLDQAQKERRGWTKAHGSATESRLKGLLAIVLRLCEDEKNGPIFEFGVGSGYTLSNMAALAEELEMTNQFYGIDSFQGLPHDEPIKGRPQSVWRKGWFSYPITMAQEAIEGLSNVELIPGFFSDVCTEELKERLGLLGKQASLIHVDSDLYSSAVIALNWCHDFIVEGTFIAFDEWGRGEERAWEEFVKEKQIEFKEVSRAGEQIIFQVTKVASNEESCR